MSKETVFSKIINRKIPSKIVYQDDLVTAFHDIAPKAPIHIIIVPNIYIATINDIQKEQEYIIGHMFTVAAKIAKKEQVAEKGYRIVVNCNDDGGQVIKHLHLHFLAGTSLGSKTL
ncbi:HIT domain-containing protein [Candidatus Tachikawaea gelatinosa]|uniref:Putative inhibitor of protein kinase C contains a transferase domain n=1 Tax=Candidatus Tachikawaea gelatinosa TaxID=1410383 RepID=A0A090AK57_9ENTR|nr:HIT domain-containing protein [Candidatus Tachikawaea gelatinosa]BAP58813.1 putative inhibitor of protein kinase C contains a transferase domain [Candidatus Tachikawaea gelatinosa]